MSLANLTMLKISWIGPIVYGTNDRKYAKYTFGDAIIYAANLHWSCICQRAMATKGHCYTEHMRWVRKNVVYIYTCSQTPGITY